MNIHLEELGLPSDLRLWHAVLLTVASTGVGVLGGFVGLALGSMRLPLLLFVGMPVTTAAGTNILVSSLSAMSGSFRHLREGRVDLRVVLAMGIPSVVGAFAGGFWSQKAPESLLLAAVTLLVAWQGVEFVAMARKEDGVRNGSPLDEPQPPSGMRRFGIGAVIGLSIGLLGGAVGLILGSIRLPALVRVLRMDLKGGGRYKPADRLLPGGDRMDRARFAGRGGLSDTCAHGRGSDSREPLWSEAHGPGEPPDAATDDGMGDDGGRRSDGVAGVPDGRPQLGHFPYGSSRIRERIGTGLRTSPEQRGVATLRRVGGPGRGSR